MYKDMRDLETYEIRLETLYVCDLYQDMKQKTDTSIWLTAELL